MNKNKFAFCFVINEAHRSASDGDCTALVHFRKNLQTSSKLRYEGWDVGLSDHVHLILPHEYFPQIQRHFYIGLGAVAQ